MIQKIKNFWLGLSDTTRAHVISAARTFASAFATSVIVLLKAGVSWHWSFWVAAFTMGAGAGLKALIENYAPPSLGGIRRG